jgi:hypothetical protein
MVAGDVEDPGPVGDELDNLLDNHHMGDREVALGELPAVDYVSVENEYVRSNALKVVD